MNLKTNIFRSFKFICLITMILYLGSCFASNSNYSFIPKEPATPKFPKFHTSRFNYKDIIYDRKKEAQKLDQNLKGVPALPKAWVFLDSELENSSSFLKKNYYDLKVLDIPVFALSCKSAGADDMFVMEIGPYYDEDPMVILKSLISSIKSKYKASSKEIELVRAVKKMSVKKYYPERCHFVQD